MANYSIIINSKFKPFSYAEMLAPVQESTQAHQQVEEAYANLSSQAAQVAAKANEQTDPKAYARYKAYAEQLAQQAEELARNGLTPSSRRNAFRMRDLYATQILPIQEAAQKRKEYADLQYKAQLANPTLLVGKRAATTSLDEFLDNPNIDFSQQYSGAMLTQQVAAQASALANELTSYGKGKDIDKYTMTFLKRYGFTKEQVVEAINNPNAAGSSRVLNAIVDSVLQSSGVSQWADAETMARARAYANQGLWAAVGKADVAAMENFGARKQLEFALNDKLNANQAARAAKAARAANRGGNGGHNGRRGRNGRSSYGGNNDGSYYQGYDDELGDHTINKPTSINRIPIGGNAAKAKGKRLSVLRQTGVWSPDKKVVHGSSIKVSVRKSGTAGQRVTYTGGQGITMRQADSPSSFYNINANLWVKGARGRFRMKTRAEFMAQGRNKDEKDALRNYYNSTIRQMQDIGVVFNGKDATYLADFYRTADRYYENSGATYFQAVSNSFGPDQNKKMLQDKLGTLIARPGTGAWVVDDSKIFKKHRPNKTATYAEILQKVGDNNDSLTYDFIFEKGNQGLLITSGPDQWFVPKKNLPTNTQRMLDEYTRKMDIYTPEKNRLIKKYGSEENYKASYEGQVLETNMINLGDDTQIGISFDIFGTYANPEAKLFNTSITQ